MKRLLYRIKVSRVSYALALLIVFGGLLAVISFFLRQHGRQFVSPCRIELKTCNSFFFEKEPILINLEISNNGTDSIDIFPVNFQYPVAEMPGQEGVFFDSKSAGLLANPKQFTFASVLGIDLQSGESYQETIRLQNFIVQPKSGHYCIPYTIALRLHKKPESHHSFYRLFDFIRELAGHFFNQNEEGVSNLEVYRGELLITIVNKRELGTTGNKKGRY